MKIKGYECLDGSCDKRWCWTPGFFQHRGAIGGGTRNTGSSTKECVYRAYHGCPHPIPNIGDEEPWKINRQEVA